jgi:hypothetical protein
MVTSPKGLGHQKDYAGEVQHHIQKTDPSSRKKGGPTKELLISGHEPQMWLDTKTY